MINNASTWTATLTHAGSVNTGAATYLSVDILTTPIYGTLAAGVNGSWCQQIARIPSPSGYVTYLFAIPSNISLTNLTLQLQTYVSAGVQAYFRVSNVTVTNVLPTITARQSLRSVVVEGAARTDASIQISSSAAALGDVLLYTRDQKDSIAAPCLSPFATSSGNADTTAVSGLSFDAGLSGTSFTIPAQQLAASTYRLMARLKRAAADAALTSVTWTVSQDGVPDVVGSASRTVSSTWGIFSLGLIELPLRTLDAGATADLVVAISASDALLVLDELWAFDTVNGRLSWLAMPANATLRYSGAAATSPLTSWWAGDPIDGEGSGLVSAGPLVVSGSQHVFDPGPMDIFVVTTAPDTAPGIGLSYWPRWIHHAGQLAAAS